MTDPRQPYQSSTYRTPYDHGAYLHVYHEYNAIHPGVLTPGGIITIILGPYFLLPWSMNYACLSSKARQNNSFTQFHFVIFIRSEHVVPFRLSTMNVSLFVIVYVASGCQSLVDFSSIGLFCIVRRGLYWMIVHGPNYNDMLLISKKTDGTFSGISGKH